LNFHSNYFSNSTSYDHDYPQYRPLHSPSNSSSGASTFVVDWCTYGRLAIVVFVVVTAIVAVTGAAVIVTATGVGTMKLSYWMTSWSMCGEHFVGTVVTMNCWTRDVAV
jgi:hypothetical protein